MKVIPNTLPQVFIVIIATTYLGLGVVGFFNPAGTVSPLDIVIQTAQAQTEIRATYGGLMFGVGLFLLYTSLSRQTARIGLVAILCTSISIGLTRLYGISVDETRAALQSLLLGIEIGSGMVALILLWKYK